MKGPQRVLYRFFDEEKVLYYKHPWKPGEGYYRKSKKQWTDDDFEENNYFIKDDYWGTDYINPRKIHSFIFTPDFHDDHKDQRVYLYETADGAEIAQRTVEENEEYNKTVEINVPEDVFKLKPRMADADLATVILWGRDIPEFIKSLKKVKNPLGDTLELYYVLHKDDHCKARKGYEF